MPINLGYNQPLFVLPFDHRESFIEIALGIKNDRPTTQQKKKIADLKQIIYEGFKLTAGPKIPKTSTAILVDEKFGDAVLKDAKKNDYIICLPAEKSGQKELTLEYGLQFSRHIKKYQPQIVKVLIRYNPAGDKKLNQRQAKKLKKISDFCHGNNYKFMVEVLVPPTGQQLKNVGSDQNRYDTQSRPGLMVEMVLELQTAGVQPDIWKVEGLNTIDDYKVLIGQIRSEGRRQVGTIVLGRGLDEKKLEAWIKIAGGIDGIIGFAIGRTIWQKPLLDYQNKKITRQQAAEQISNKYYHFYQIFTGQK